MGPLFSMRTPRGRLTVGKKRAREEVQTPLEALPVSYLPAPQNKQFGRMAEVKGQ